MEVKHNAVLHWVLSHMHFNVPSFWLEDDKGYYLLKNKACILSSFSYLGITSELQELIKF